jgi:hypothetical protein
MQDLDANSYLLNDRINQFDWRNINHTPWFRVYIQKLGNNDLTSWKHSLKEWQKESNVQPKGKDKRQSREDQILTS